jgi:hypothetical protein
VTDIPPIPDEEWMPPIRNLLYKVLFYYTYAGNAVEFWNTEEKHWYKEVEHFAEPSKSIHETVSGLIAPSDSDLDKVKKLYKPYRPSITPTSPGKKGSLNSSNSI